jgi:amino acid permease
VAGLIGFIILGVVIDCGGVGNQGYLGAKYWRMYFLLFSPRFSRLSELPHKKLQSNVFLDNPGAFANGFQVCAQVVLFPHPYFL